MCKTHTKSLLGYNLTVKIGKREIATQLTKCNECQRNKSTFLKEIKPKKKSLNCKTWISIAKTGKTH